MHGIGSMGSDLVQSMPRLPPVRRQAARYISWDRPQFQASGLSFRLLPSVRLILPSSSRASIYGINHLHSVQRIRQAARYFLPTPRATSCLLHAPSCVFRCCCVVACWRWCRRLLSCDQQLCKPFRQDQREKWSRLHLRLLFPSTARMRPSPVACVRCCHLPLQLVIRFRVVGFRSMGDSGSRCPGVLSRAALSVSPL